MLPFASRVLYHNNSIFVTIGVLISDSTRSLATVAVHQVKVCNRVPGVVSVCSASKSSHMN